MPKKYRKWLSVAPLALVMAAAFSFGIWDFGQKEISGEGLLSANSLQTLQSLNFEHEMFVEELVVTEEEEPLLAQVFMANSFKDTKKLDRSKRGLIVNLEGSETYLMLRPVVDVSDLELEVIARQYEDEIDEFEYVELDQDVVLAGEPVYWGADMDGEVMLAEENPSPVYEPIKIGIIDSGVDVDHEFFRGTETQDGWNTIDLNTDTHDDVGHGTHIAGIIASNAPGAILVPYKIYNAQGGRLSNVIAAIDAAIDQEMDILNMSFGLMSPSNSLENMVQSAFDKGIIVAAAAGNNSSSKGFYPASYNTTLAVASVDFNGDKLPKSNYGNWVKLAAYGYQVRSTLPNDQYGYKSGNSQSTGFVSAAIARLMASAGLENHLSMDEVLVELYEQGEFIEEGELAGVLLVR